MKQPVTDKESCPWCWRYLLERDHTRGACGDALSCRKVRLRKLQRAIDVACAGIPKRSKDCVVPPPIR